MQELANYITAAQTDIQSLSLIELDNRISSVKSSGTTCIEDDVFLMLAYMSKDFIYETSYYMGRIKNYYLSHSSKTNEVKDFIKYLKEYKPDGQGNYWEIDWDKLLDIGRGGGNGGGGDSDSSCCDCCDCIIEDMSDNMRSRGVSETKIKIFETILYTCTVAGSIGLIVLVISALFDSDSCARSCAEDSWYHCTGICDNCCTELGDFITENICSCT